MGLEYPSWAIVGREKDGVGPVDFHSGNPETAEGRETGPPLWLPVASGGVGLGGRDGEAGDDDCLQEGVPSAS